MLVTHRSFLPAGMKLLDCYPRYKYCVFPKWDTPARNATKICFPTFLEGCGGPSRNQINYVNKIIDLHVFLLLKMKGFLREVMVGNVRGRPCTINESLFQHLATLKS